MLPLPMEKLLKVASGIPADNAKKVVDAKGMYITPGLIDLHTHVFVGSTGRLCRWFFQCISG